MLFHSKKIGLAQLFALVLWVVSCGLITNVADAGAPDGTTRTFLVVVPLDSDLDFESDDSLLLVVAPPDKDAGTSFLEFVDSNADPDFDSTIWEYGSAMHVRLGGADVPGTIAWLVTPETPDAPPSGSLALTGPDSGLVQAFYYRSKCTGGDCGSLNEGKYFIADAETGEDLIVVVTVRFSQ